ncbi:hypothetical protein MNBD_GAMMA26-2055, partial [hydrothermal vent metagenome]
LQLSSIEIGEVSVEGLWKQVVLTKTFVDPVVVVKPASRNDDDPVVVRVRNVSAIGFEVRLQEWDYLDGQHLNERISYIVMERGHHILSDGTQVEAGRFDTSRMTGFDAVNFSQAFSTGPVVIASVTSFNEADAVVGRVTAVGANGFRYRLQEQESNARSHVVETVSYIAWELSQGTSDGVTFEVGHTGRVVNHRFHPISFSSSYASEPLFLADMQTFYGGDTANLRWQSKSALGVSVQVDEEQSRDSEARHTKEAVGYVVLHDASTGSVALVDSDGDGLLDEAEIYTYGTDPSVLDSDGDKIDDGVELSFWGANWSNDYDGDGMVNLLDDDADNDGYSDGVEQAAGSDPSDPVDTPLNVFNNLQLSSIEIGEVSVEGLWKQVVLTKTFVDPVVVVKPASRNDDDPVVVRVRNVSAIGFEVRLQEWDYLDGQHLNERISYIVMERGHHILSDGTQVEAGRFDTSRMTGFDAVNFSQAFSTGPVVIASVTSFNEADAVVGRVTAVGANGFRYRLQEQESNARSHVVETVSYIAWELSQGTSDGVTFEVGHTGRVVNHRFHPISFSSSYASEPLFLADMQTFYGGDTANLRWQSKSALGVSVQVDEEQSRDSEARHTKEAVGYIIIEANPSP